MMSRRRRSESGQAIVLLALALVGLAGFAALAIDAGRMYSERRRAQNAADNAALAAARAMCLGGDYVSVGLQLAGGNGYDSDGLGDTVTVVNPPGSGPYAGNPEYVEVVIVSNFPGTLIQFFRPGGLQVTVRAVGKCLPGVSSGIPAIYAGSETCITGILWSGASGSVEGGMHSNRDVQITGSNTSIDGMASYVTTFDARPGTVTLNPPPPDNPVQSRVIGDPLLFDIADYAPSGSKAATAMGIGQYRYCDCNIDMNWLKRNHYFDEATNTIMDGLYYSTGNITITGSGVRGNAVTLVAEGDIWLRGPNQVINAYVDEILGFSGMAYDTDGMACNSPVIKLSHSGGVYSGYLYAPFGHINVSGANVQINGGLIGYAVSVTGADVNVYNPSLFIPPPPGTIEISE